MPFYLNMVESILLKESESFYNNWIRSVFQLYFEWKECAIIIDLCELFHYFKIIARVEKINVCFCAFSLILCNAPVFHHFRLRLQRKKPCLVGRFGL